MIDMAQDHLRMVLDILGREAPACEARAFGSRVTGKAQRFSDLDVALLGPEPLDWRRLEAIRDAFAVSDLPFKVDVADWRSLSDEFKDIIADRYEVIRPASTQADAPKE